MSSTKKIKIYLLNKNLNFNRYLFGHEKHAKDYISISKSKMGSNYQGGIIYTFTKEADPPYWSNYLSAMATQKSKKFSLPSKIESRAIAFLKVKINSNVSKTFAITFGGAHQFLKKEFIEKDFANKITRTLVANENVTSLDTVNLDKNIFNTQKNSFKSIPEHRLLNYKEIAFIKKLQGKGQLLGEKITVGGSAGLDLTAKFDFHNNEIIKLLVSLGHIFDSNASTKFSVNELLTNEKNTSIINKLNTKFKKKIADLVFKKNPVDNRNLRGISLLIPDSIPLGNIINVFIKGLFYKDTLLSKSTELNALDFFEKLRILNISKFDFSTSEEIVNKLRHSKIEVTIDDNGHPSKYSYSIYESLTMELTLNNDSYLLFYGKWYKVNHSFYTNLLSEINQISTDNNLLKLNYPKYSGQDEEIWNTDFCSNTFNKKLFLMDQNFYTFDNTLLKKYNLNTYSKIEICDALYFSTKAIEFIHVKRKKSASGISHLSNQAVVAATLFNEQQSLLINVINNFISPEKLTWYDQKKYVTLIILDERFKKTDTPIHSVLTILELMALVQNINTLKSLGYEVSLKGIS